MYKCAAGVVLTILNTCPLITTIITGERLIMKTYDDDNRSITANGLTVIHIRDDKRCQVTVIHFVQNIF